MVITTGAASYVLTRPVAQTTVVGCYEAASTSSPLHIALLRGTPIRTCAALWDAGEMGPSRNVHLIECVESSGAAVVLPGDYSAICSALGLGIPEGLIKTPAKKIEDLTSMLSNDFLVSICLTESQGRIDALNALGVLEIRDWKVISPRRRPRARSCVSFSIQQSSQVIKLIPVPAGTSIDTTVATNASK